LCQLKISIACAGVAIFKGHFTIHQITKKTVALWVFLATGLGMEYLDLPAARLILKKCVSSDAL
jgi:hypothetical protein